MNPKQSDFLDTTLFPLDCLEHYAPATFYVFHSVAPKSHLSAPVVLIIKNENANWLIDGWRGFVPSQGENKDSELLHNIRHDNQFP